jgi:hypothetical protein
MCATASYAAGLPVNDQQYFCPANGSSCYFYVSATLSFNDSRTNCRNRGGYLVAYNTGVCVCGCVCVGGVLCNPMLALLPGLVPLSLPANLL